ncbi:hypothetical protein EJ08DRAFT_682862, partial [Tothia fuscella]
MSNKKQTSLSAFFGKNAAALEEEERYDGDIIYVAPPRQIHYVDVNSTASKKRKRKPLEQIDNESSMPQKSNQPEDTRTLDHVLKSEGDNQEPVDAEFQNMTETDYGELEMSACEGGTGTEEGEGEGDEEESFHQTVKLDHDLDSAAADAVSKFQSDESDVELTAPKAVKRPVSRLERGKLKKFTSAKKIPGRDLDLTLPPISNISEIFLDTTRKALDRGLNRVTEGLGDRPLRAATMCSGTESPLLALKVVQQHLRQLCGQSFNVEHIFNAEIEPFKQAYIQRNFSPPLLFRDITEFTLSADKSNMTAFTAYGAKAKAPRDIDILIAGSSCVDASLLNTTRVKDLHEREGETHDTFMAVRRYMDWARPPMVILENVNGDEIWRGIQDEIEAIGYSMTVIDVDSKNFYLPHTRQRKYCLCLNKEDYSNTTALLTKWGQHMCEYRRRASAPVSDFLLSSSDPRNLALLAREDLNARDPFDTNDTWEKCRGRHFVRRREKCLGPRRPVTAHLPEHGYQKWLKGRVPRELDVIDICHLYQAVTGLDSQHKTRIIDISQNVDRVDSSPLGISGCITPGGDYALLLQGIPVDEVWFTSETSRELTNLAGNAMSSTIIGPAILSALLVGLDGILQRTPNQAFAFAVRPNHRILVGANHLVQWESKAKTAFDDDPARLLEDATDSARRCFCEGQTRLSKYDIELCLDCGQTVCEKCKGSPEHHYSLQETQNRRQTPQSLLVKWNKHFPLALAFGEARGDFSRYKDIVDTRTKESYFQYVAKAFTEPFNHPIARCKVVAKSTLLVDYMEWEFFIPCKKKVPVKISGTGKQTSSWRARLGLSKFEGERIWDTLKIDTVDLVRDEFAVDITGCYRLVTTCGTPCQTMYRKERTGDSDKLYFFLESDPVGPHTHDSFVFSRNCRRLEPKEKREVILRLCPSWRPWPATQVSIISAFTTGFWTQATPVKLSVLGPEIKYHALCPAKVKLQPQSLLNCWEYLTLLACSFMVSTPLSKNWDVDQFVDTGCREFYDDFGWTLRECQDTLVPKEWMSIQDLSSLADQCMTCAPNPPSLKWHSAANAGFIIREDHLEAANDESAMKNRPPAFALKAIRKDSKHVDLSIGLNLNSLAHRAIAFLREENRPQDISVEWNLDSNFVDTETLRLPKLNDGLKTTSDIRVSNTTHRLNMDLLPEQQRSLAWMKSQEAGADFVLQHVEEAVLPRIGWKAEQDCELIPTAATLIVVPAHLISQWRSECAKFLPQSYEQEEKIRVVKTTRDLQNLKVRDFQEAKIVLVSWTVLQHD